MIQCVDDGLDLFGRADEFDHLLESTGAVAVQCDLHHLWSSSIDQDSTLIVIRELKELLAKVISERIF